mmetsp:Transcript_12475/g.37423  ORF Transcript_12475/g.37423 Transcript_12475/m.37423 type:complete len:213 (+) Transcript_12475:731-1369(+)
MPAGAPHAPPRQHGLAPRLPARAQLRTRQARERLPPVVLGARRGARVRARDGRAQLAHDRRGPVAPHLGRGFQPAPHARVPVLSLPRHAPRAPRRGLEPAPRPLAPARLVPQPRRRAPLPRRAQVHAHQEGLGRSREPHQPAELRRRQRVLLVHSLPRLCVPRCARGRDPWRRAPARGGGRALPVPGAHGPFGRQGPRPRRRARRRLQGRGR